MPGQSCPWAHIVAIDDVSDEGVARFSSGEPRIDNWFHKAARAADARKDCTVHVCIDEGGGIVGFFTLSTATISAPGVTRSFAGGITGDIPAILIGKLAIDERLQTCAGHGSRLLNHALHMIVGASRIVGARLIIVDALDDGLAAWYSERGFTRVKDPDSKRLVCKIKRAQEICDALGERYFTF